MVVNIEVYTLSQQSGGESEVLVVEDEGKKIK